MKKNKSIALWTIILLWFTSTVDAVSVWTLINPYVPGYSRIEWDYSFFDIIRVVNSYLRFTIWFFCFLFTIWNGFQLIIARGNEKNMESTKKALIWCSIGLVSCFLAYIIVNIVINLFR